MSSGSVIGSLLRARYRITQLVGEGGNGAVYQAEDLRLGGRLSAIKEIRADPYATPAQLEQSQAQFRREALTLAQLDHPNLPKVYDFFTEGGRSYLVMDFVAGPDLRQLVDQARARGEFLVEKDVLGWVAQLLDALDYLHSQTPPVIHRDIKPSNIKLTSQGRVKLVDFGLVKPMDPDDPRTITVVRGVGSLPYTPLEQYGGGAEHTDPRSDLYAVGATLYHLLTGRTPATAQQRFLEPGLLPAPRSLNVNVSPHIEKAIIAALSMHPDKRPADVATLRAMLLADNTLLETPRPGVWGQAIRENVALIVLVALLLALSIFATSRTSRGAMTPTSLPTVSVSSR